VNADDLKPRCHEPPLGWPPEVFDRVTDALAAMLVAAVQRAHRSVEEAEPGPAEERDEP
jgi:hypothetical protein